MEIARGTHKFDTGPFNWYLVEDARQLTLVDAGFPGHYRQFRDGLAAIGRTVEDVAAVVLTHAHADHMGIADRVGREANAPVYIHKDDAASAGRILQLPWYGLLSRAWRPYTAQMLAHAMWNGVFGTSRVRNPVPMGDDQVLDVPGRPQVIHTPGHTPGEVCLLFADRGVLISGDTLVTRDLYSGAAGPPQVTHPLLSYNYAEAFRSLDRLAGLGRLRMLPGHGTPWDGDMRDGVALAEALRRK